MTAKKSTRPGQPELYTYTGPREVYYPAYGVTAKPGMDPIAFDPQDPDLPVPPDSDWVVSSGKMGVNVNSDPKDS